MIAVEGDTTAARQNVQNPEEREQTKQPQPATDPHLFSLGHIVSPVAFS